MIERTEVRQTGSRVNISEDYEVRYWSAKWSVSAERLKAAVEKVGASADAVAKESGKQP